MTALPGWITGGTATALSATGAWIRSLSVIELLTARFERAKSRHAAQGQILC
jgi:hypothetical protein